MLDLTVVAGSLVVSVMSVYGYAGVFYNVASSADSS